MELKREFEDLRWSDDISALERCEHMLVLLTTQTWVQGDSSGGRGKRNTEFIRELCKAMELGVHRQLAHEVRSARQGDDTARHACSFDDFFANDSTPKFIIDAGLYNEIAINLAGFQWRPAGILALGRQFARGGGARSKWRVSLLAGRDAAALYEGSQSLVTEESRPETSSVVRGAVHSITRAVSRSVARSESRTSSAAQGTPNAKLLNFGLDRAGPDLVRWRASLHVPPEVRPRQLSQQV